jgi:organic hydroperoxide reductase OsmC/OhrA
MKYTSHLSWNRGDAAFTPKTYDRTHSITFGGGIAVEGSAAPEFLGKAALVNPEELFVASISSCFMLTFVYLACTKNLVVNSYTAEATGTLGKNEEGKMAMTEVVLKPSIQFENNQQPDPAVLQDLFHKAHDMCFISCSVKTKVSVQHAAIPA